MKRVTWRNLIAHRRRFTGCFLAALLGVAFLTGTLVLGDTLNRNFDQLFANANAGTDVVVRNATNITVDGSGPTLRSRGLVDASLLAEIARVPGVASAAGQVTGYGELLGANGKVVGGNGPPRVTGNWVTDPTLNPYKLVQGRAPRTANEVVINKKAAQDGHLAVGSKTIVQTPDPVPVTVVGIATFGDASGFGGETFSAFDLAGAQQHLLGGQNMLSDVLVRAEPGVSQSTLAARVRAVLPRSDQALTGAQYTKEATSDVTSGFLSFFRTFLVIFAGIALLVGAFGIHNTFAIVVAQRTRESALLRAIGASRRDIVTAVVGEALVIGLVASGVGVLAGLGVAGLLKGLFDGFGFALPAGGLVVTPFTVGIAIAVGVIVTLVAAISPARRASRIAPIAALRESEEPGAPSRARTIAAAVLVVGGLVLALSAVLSHGGGALPRAGFGSMLLLGGVVCAGPVVARPVSALVGAPLARGRGAAGKLGRENAMRSPRRTAGTASALLVGVAIVTLFTVIAASLKAEINDTIAQSFAGDLVVNTPSFGGGGLSPTLVNAVSAVPTVAHAAGIGPALVTINGTATRATATEPAQFAALVNPKVKQGSLAALGPNQIAVSTKRAADNHWPLGSTVVVGFSDGKTVDAQIGAIYDDTRLVGSIVVPEAMYAAHAVQPVDQMVLIGARHGVPLAQVKQQVKQAVAPFGAPAVQDRQQYTASAAEGANLMLGIVYVLLALAIVIALMGIANTLSLAVHERTRELGLLRAVGETRRQLRSMIRVESVIVSLFGTLGGVGVGVFVAWALVKSASSSGFTSFAAPPVQLFVLLVLGAMVGVVAAIRPARRAARLDVLQAIAQQ
jgi:putative ABC transport system permease protein